MAGWRRGRTLRVPAATVAADGTGIESVYRTSEWCKWRFKATAEDVRTEPETGLTLETPLDSRPTNPVRAVPDERAECEDAH